MLAEKVTNLEEFKKQLHRNPTIADNQNDEDISQLLNDFREKFMAIRKPNSIECRGREIDIIDCEKVAKLKNEIVVLEMKAQYSFPKIAIGFIIFSTMGFTFSLCSFLITVFLGIKIIHPLENLLFILGFLGLLITGIISIKDWGKFINNVGN